MLGCPFLPDFLVVVAAEATTLDLFVDISQCLGVSCSHNVYKVGKEPRCLRTNIFLRLSTNAHQLFFDVFESFCAACHIKVVFKIHVGLPVHRF